MIEDLRISDHAVLRFLERYHKLDVESVKDEMRSLFPKEAIECLEEGEFPDITNQVKFIIKQKTVITVAPTFREKPSKKTSTKTRHDIIKYYERKDEKYKTVRKNIVKRKPKRKKYL